MLDKHIPFCLVKLPGTEQPIFFPGSLELQPEEGPYLILQEWERNERCYFSLQANNQTSEVLDTYTVPNDTTFEDYGQQFEKFQKAFAEDGIRKAILSRISNVNRPTLFNPIEAFAKLCVSRKDTFNYLLLHPKNGLWMGASPEILLKKKGIDGQTVSLAGTQPKSEEEYTWNEKELEEQELVSEHIRSVLQKAEITDFKETGPTNAEAGNVAHLKTTFDFEFKSGLSPLGLTEKLHPTPAISGLPVSEATKLINQTESHSRLLYTGYLGLVDNEDMDIYVNLRCMQIHSNEISIYVGGGITNKSVLEDEWQETEAKAKTMKNIIDESR